MKYLLIINPISGTGNKDGLAEKVEGRLSPLGVELDIRYTTCRGDATRLAREAVDRRLDGVLAMGGDGTVNETARALCDTGVPLGIIPAGSGNGLARHLNIPIDPILSLDVIGQNHVEAIDYCTVNGRQYFCTMGVGFDAAVSQRFAMQSRRGLLMYIKSALNEYAGYTPQQYTLVANGNIITEKAFIIAVANASQYGNNAYIAPGASITDGLVDVTIVHSGNPLETARMGLDMMTGYLNKNVLIETFRAPSVALYRQSSGPSHIDGEPLELPAILDIKCHRHGLMAFTPAVQPDFQPIITPVKSTLSGLGISLRRLLHLR